MESRAPLVVRWHALELDPPQAGASQVATVELENTGSATWRTRRDDGARGFLSDRAEPAPGWQEHVRQLHEEGYAAVGGALAAETGLLRRADAALEPYVPGGGRNPAFAHPLVCPSLLPPLEPNT